MFFALVAHDKPNSLAKRQEIRPSHLKHLESLGDKLILAGPFLDDAGGMTGSIVVIDAESYDAAKAIFDADPFSVGGLFDSVTIKRWNLGINNTKK